jgi:hypothetical protein
MIKGFLLSFFLNAFLSTTLFGQSGTVSTGGELHDGPNTISFSIGQTFYQLSSANASITPGLQQAYKVIAIVELDNTVSVYPNPTTNYIILKVTNSDYKNYHFEISDVSGKRLIKNDIKEIETSVALSEFAQAVYICKIFLNGKKVNTFKILKI